MKIYGYHCKIKQQTMKLILQDYCTTQKWLYNLSKQKRKNTPRKWRFQNIPGKMPTSSRYLEIYRHLLEWKVSSLRVFAALVYSICPHSQSNTSLFYFLTFLPIPPSPFPTKTVHNFWMYLADQLFFQGLLYKIHCV